MVLYLCPSQARRWAWYHTCVPARPGSGRGTIPVSQPGQEVGVVLYLCPSQARRWAWYYTCVPARPGGGRGTIPVSQPGQEVGVSVAAGCVYEVVAEMVGQVANESTLHPLQ